MNVINRAAVSLREQREILVNRRRYASDCKVNPPSAISQPTTRLCSQSDVVNLVRPFRRFSGPELTGLHHKPRMAT